jgi:hypothetical protein
MNSNKTEKHIQILNGLDQETPDLPLFRYMKLSTLLLLLKGKAFFPAVANLCKEDPFEGTLFCEPEWLWSALSELKGQDSAAKLDKWLREKAKGWEREMIDSEETRPGSRSRLLAEIYIRELRDRRAAWCWFQNDLESAGMWSVYGHKGVAVRTSLSELTSALPSNRSFQVARMRYVDRRPCSENPFDPKIKDRALITRPHLLKAIEYKHENEIRIVAKCPAQCGGIIVDDIKWQSLINEVIISPLLPAQEAEAVKAALEQYPWQKSVVIERSKLLPDNSMNTHDWPLEVVRSIRGGCYEPTLPDIIAEL